MKKVVIVAVYFFLIAHLQVQAQNSCEATLTRAQEEFDAGRFESVPEILKPCLERSQNRDWEQRAYLLLAETYLLLENAEMADASYLKVLKANPEFETDESRDPIDLVYLSKRFTATPIFSFYGKVGLNASFATVIHDVEIEMDDPTDQVTEKYSTGAGWQGGLGVQFHYNENLGLSAELNYMFTSFIHRAKGMFQEANYSVAFTDRQTWLSVPILVRYTWTGTRLEPFAYIGASMNLLVRDRSDVVVNSNVESPVVDYLDMRNKFNRSLIAGGGLRYKWGLRYLFGEIRYSHGLSNLAVPESRFDRVSFSWPYVDDDFRLNNLMVNVGYIHPIYKPRKLKRAKTGSVLRQMGRRKNEGK